MWNRIVAVQLFISHCTFGVGFNVTESSINRLFMVRSSVFSLCIIFLPECINIYNCASLVARRLPGLYLSRCN